MIEVHLLLADIADSLLAITGAGSFRKDAPILTPYNWVEALGAAVQRAVVTGVVLAATVALVAGAALVGIGQRVDVPGRVHGVVLWRRRRRNEVQTAGLLESVLLGDRKNTNAGH